jgi:hypothetical protein
LDQQQPEGPSVVGLVGGGLWWARACSLEHSAEAGASGAQHYQRAVAGQREMRGEAPESPPAGDEGPAAITAAAWVRGCYALSRGQEGGNWEQRRRATVKILALEGVPQNN